MSLDTSPHLFYARVDPRRRTHAVGMYTHVLDQHGIVYNQPIVLNERQAGVAIEGVIRHNENRDDGGRLCHVNLRRRTGAKSTAVAQNAEGFWVSSVNRCHVSKRTASCLR